MKNKLSRRLLGWFRQSFLWCAFLTFVVFGYHGNGWAWLGVILLVLWFLTAGARRAYGAMNLEHKNYFTKLGVFFQLVGLAITQRNMAYLLDAERERRQLEYDAAKVDPNVPVPLFNLEVPWSVLITIICSIVTVIVLEQVF